MTRAPEAPPNGAPGPGPLPLRTAAPEGKRPGEQDPTVDRPSRAYRRGRFLRSVAACDEDVLHLCPEERFKFSGLGAVIIGTSVLAALSMALGLSIAFRLPFVAMVPFGLVWGAFILAFDRWLVAGGNGFRHFAPRVLVAAIFGFIIAEPISLRVFEDSIDAELATSQREELTSTEEDLTRCNPVIDDHLVPEAVPAGCGPHVLAEPVRPGAAHIPEVPEDLAAREAALETEQASLQEDLTEERQLMADEAAGHVGAGLSGKVGDGPATAVRSRTVTGIEADLERVGTDLAAIKAQTDPIRARAQRAETAATTKVDEYNAAIGPAIADEVAARREELSEPAQLGRRMDALTDLMDESNTMMVARLLLVLFFLAIDTSPALVRWTSTGGPYDQILRDRQLDAVERGHAEREVRSERRQTRTQKIVSRLVHERESVEQELQFERQLATARRQQRSREEARLLADRLRDTGRRSPERG